MIDNEAHVVTLCSSHRVLCCESFLEVAPSDSSCFLFFPPPLTTEEGTNIHYT